MSKTRLDIKEYDEAGNLVATYIQSASKRSDQNAARVDVVVSSLIGLFARQCLVQVHHSHTASKLPDNPKTIWNKCLDVFLPAGYPQSVTDDYLK